ncbi:Mur ligase [Absidia repens]|uniref:Folylpolyglutamate synthase n=1 Tax=Absidia repens TaxID=90262 RepID=A0A1X2I2G7_9FUNG|nr:Mur ligase [Absidia repens]
MLHTVRQFSTSNIKRMSFTYSESVNKLNSLQTNAALLDQLRKAGPRMNQYSLPEMRHYFKRIGYEPKDFDHLQIIHVTGTKGKGSTSALTQSILRHFPTDRPLRTGLFTSPHLVAVRERIRINGEPISEELFAKYSEDVWTRLENTKDQHVIFGQEFMTADDPKKAIRDQRAQPDKPIYFRYLTLLALHAFVQEKVDVAILEVGVGGEYDSTNIIEKPIVCGITALGLDHVSVLGNTIDQIAWHKSGIIKQNRPVVCFDQPPEAMEVVKQRAADKNAALEIIYPSQIADLKDIDIGLAGVHQCYNSLTAVALAKKWLEECRGIQFDKNQPIPEGFREGLKKVVWPGRGQRLPIVNTKYASKVTSDKDMTWYLDGAHTMESLGVCTEWFKDVAQKDGNESDANDVSRILVFNCTNGRDGPRLLSTISQLQTSATKFDHVVFTTNVTFREGYTTDNTNNTVSIADALAMQTMLADSWSEQVPGFGKENIHVVGSIEEAVDWTVNFAKNATSKKIQVLTTGSLILVGNTLTVLGMPSQ